MTHDDVQRWLDRYVAAWRSGRAEEIGDLFAEDAVYHYRPYEDPDHSVHGRDAIVADWLEDADPPGSWEASYDPWTIEGNRAVAIGSSRYLALDDGPRTYHNAFLLTFDGDGRCVEFREFFMREGQPAE